MSNNDSEILGDWAGLGYFTQEDSDHSIAVCYKDGGRDVVLKRPASSRTRRRTDHGMPEREVASRRDEND